MDKILEKWDEILSTVKHEHDISDISFALYFAHNKYELTPKFVRS